ncbi:MAG TPA: IS110 family transposase [Candidatus Sulfotelmatobacter sp.]|nr:IS110 family transposase [Candidatus Sulfotelmatobacter sp.]
MSGKRRKKAGNEQPDWRVNLDVVHPNAAGIDIGNESHYVAVPPDRDAQPVRQFACFTEALQQMAAWLKSCGIDTVAMQSTGVYWLPVYEILTEEGLQVFLVNARHTKNLPGRKTDVQECQWLLQLHTFGLLNNSFRPPEEICVLRAYWRQRAEHVISASACIQRMQKVLTEMNVQLANVISDISGLTGLTIIQAILDGERDRYKLAALADVRIQASREDIARSLEGNWRKELLFILQQELNLYQVYQEQIAECDTALAAHLQTLEDKVEPGSEPPVAKAGKKAGSNAPTSFDLRGELYRISGTDLTQIDGINIMNAQTIIAEVGIDMSRFPSEAHFASFLGLCPDNQITGGKVFRRSTRHVENRAATALRMAATSLWRSKTYLGAKFRRLRARLGAPKAITAMAHMLARLVYRMLRYGEQYVDKGMKYYEEKYREHEIRSIQKKAKDLGLVVTLTPTAV